MQYKWGFKNYLFLGFGLIGGSIARAIRKLQPNAQIRAYVRHPERLQNAVREGVLDALSESLTADVPTADLIILCAPTGPNSQNLKAIAPFVGEHTLITDVGSVKQDIQSTADSLGLSSRFLGGHPMAGKEQSGYDSADENILVNACYILTPSSETKSEWISDFTALVKAMQCRVLTADPEYHDRAVAAISHLPHLIAASLVTLAKANDNSEGFLKTIAAGGFKDITRIASSDPEVWAAICESNTDNIRALLTDYIKALTDIDKALADKDFDTIRHLFENAGDYRGSIS